MTNYGDHLFMCLSLVIFLVKFLLQALHFFIKNFLINEFSKLFIYPNDSILLDILSS